MAVANGFRNIQNLVQKMKRKRCDYDYVEVRFDLITSSFPCLLLTSPPSSLLPPPAPVQVMACPGGCLNGGAQLRAVEAVETGREMVARCSVVVVAR